MSFARGTRQTSTMTTATIERSRRLRSSIRCDMNVSCAPSGGGRPKRCPSVRAVLGSRSGPMTTSATTAMTTISEKPMSNISGASGRLLFLDFGVDRRARDLLRGRGLRFLGFGLAAPHAFLEALHRAAQILPDVAQFLRAEDQHDDEQYDQPMPDAQTTHDVLLDT